MKYELELVGVSPLLMHSPRGANPLDQLVKLLKSYTSKKKKTDEDYEKMAEIEYRLGSYFDDKIGFYIPANCIEQSIICGSKQLKLGKKMTTAILISEEKVKLISDAPDTIEEAMKDPNFVDVRAVNVNRAKIMRTRPRFDRWRLKFTLELDESIINSEEFISSVNYAGSLAGIGDYRPKYGRYEAKITRGV